MREVKRITRLRSLAATVLMLMGAVLAVGQGAPEPTISSFSSLTEHDVIEIDGNMDLASTVSIEGWDGSGIPSDPYVIEDLLIDAEGGDNGIVVKNTSANFVITNCTVTNVTRRLSSEDDGAIGAIFLDNCSNALIMNVVLVNDEYGIRLNEALNVKIDNITHSIAYGFGVRVDSSGPGITIINSTFNYVQNSIQVFGSDQIRIEQNDIQFPTYGIYMQVSDRIDLFYNTINGGYEAIYSYHCYHLNITDNIITTTITGVDLFESFNCQINYNTVDNSYWEDDVGNGVFTKYSGDLEIEWNEFSFLDYGIQFQNSSNIIAHDNSFENCYVGLSGIKIENITSFDSVARSVTTGFGLSLSVNATIHDWTITDASYTGIGLMYVTGSEFKSMELIGNSLYGMIIQYSNGNLFDDIRIVDPSLGISLINSDDNDIWNCNIDTYEREGIYLEGSESNRFVHNRVNSADMYTAIMIEQGSYSNEFYSNALYRGGLSIHPYAYPEPFDMRLYSSQYVEISNTYEGRFILYMVDEDLDSQTLTTSYGQIFVINSKDARFKDQYIHGVEKGIVVVGSSNILFTSPRVAYNKINNIFVFESQDVSFSGLRSWGCGVGGEIYASSGIEFSGAKFWDGSLGIHGDFSTDLSITASTFENLSSPAVYISDTSLIDIRSSTFKGPSNGIFMRNNNKTTVADCSFDLVEMGIVLENCQEMDIIRNKISDTPEEAVNLLDVVSSRIMNNTIDRSKHGIVAELCDDLQFFGNDIGHTDIGIALTDSTTAHILNNTLRYNNNGVNLYRTSYSEARYNLFFRNTDYAIRATQCTYNSFLSNSFIRNKGTDENYHSFRLQVYDDSPNSEWGNDQDNGNYYSDKYGPDDDDDGIVDSVYSVAGGALADRYPLVYSPVTIISPPREINATMGLDFIYIDWQPPLYVLDGEIDGYVIFRGPTPDELTFYDETMDAISDYYDNYVESGVSYYYQVRAYNELGFGEASEIITGYSDDSAPMLNIKDPQEDAWYKTKDVLLRWDGWDEDSEIVRYLVRCDDGEWTDLGLETQFTIRGLSEGEHTAHVAAFNLVGLSTEKEVEFQVDTTKPEIDFGSSDPVYTNDLIYTVVWSTSDPGGEIDSIRSRLNMDSWSPSTHDTWTNVGLKEGRNTFDLEVVDKAGNIASQRLTIYLDTDPPVLTSISPGNESFIHLNYREVNFQWICKDDVSDISSFRLSVKGEPIDLIGTVRSWTLELNEGISQVQLDAYDIAGNVATLKWMIDVDLTAPGVLDYWPKGGNINVNTPIYVAFTEPMYIGSVSFMVEGASGEITWDENRLSFTLKELLEYGMTYMVKVNGPDLAGNMMGQFNWQFSTSPSGTIKGRVLGSNGKAIFNAIVTIDGGRSVLTDNDGRFSIQVAPGQYTVTVEKDGYEKKTYSMNIYSGEVKDLGNVRIKKEGFYLSPTLLAAFSISAAAIVISLLIISGVILHRRRSRKMEFFVVDGETVGKQPHLHVELEEDDDDEEFEIFDYRGAPDYYSVLGVERSASMIEIRRAYRRMAYMYHPDKLQAAGIDMSMQEIHTMMRELNEAKSTLLDPYRKQAYDISLLDSEL